jgi:hypothetical protein
MQTMKFCRTMLALALCAACMAPVFPASSDPAPQQVSDAPNKPTAWDKAAAAKYLDDRMDNGTAAIWGSPRASRVVVGAPADHIFASPLLLVERAEAVGEGADCHTRGRVCSPRPSNSSP